MTSTETLAETSLTQTVTITETFTLLFRLDAWGVVLYTFAEHVGKRDIFMARCSNDMRWYKVTTDYKTATLDRRRGYEAHRGETAYAMLQFDEALVKLRAVQEEAKRMIDPFADTAARARLIMERLRMKESEEEKRNA